MARRRAGGSVLGTLGLLAGGVFVIGPALAWLRLVPAIVGFVLFALGGVLALVVGLASVVQALRGRGIRPGGAVAIFAGVAFLVVAARGRGGPMINDFTTDLADPPAFRNAATLPANQGRDMAYPRTFEPMQQECCADLHPARVRLDGKETFARVQSVANSMPGWRITATDPNGGTLEVTATTALFGFQDDIAIRVRPDGDGASRVDMRSKSRDGKGDLGTNAARIRAFVRQVEAAGR
ncbi:MAG TPA: DUF1499 domain-containing protein [Candidatus Binatus sp.]|nr:DUF1499 domain-containing protein [Candidatus Binatus sp.]